jgi:queuine tRNA-ribosyltransferase
MPVGTQGAVKALTHRQLIDAGAQIILGNTYHLHLRPGEGLVARRGGLHRFIGWDRAILTDSGGYQVFSLARAARSARQAPTSSRTSTAAPVSSPLKAPSTSRPRSAPTSRWCSTSAWPGRRARLRSAPSMDLTLRWARRARTRMLALREGRPSPGPDGQALDPVPLITPTQAQFGIIQGGTYPSLRTAVGWKARSTSGSMPTRIGGLSVGEPPDVMYAMVEHTAPLLPADRPRYLMGVGTPADLVEAVARGIDMFDCVLPTRNARNGQLFTRTGKINIRNARYAEDEAPVDDACKCYTCRTFSRAYLRHLHVSGEMTASTLNSLHNVQFYLDTMEAIREAISFGRFEGFRQDFHRSCDRLALDT